jgi:hypothetical protein
VVLAGDDAPILAFLVLGDLAEVELKVDIEQKETHQGTEVEADGFAFVVMLLKICADVVKRYKCEYTCGDLK